jgi:hypothetical protein
LEEGGIWSHSVNAFCPYPYPKCIAFGEKSICGNVFAGRERKRASKRDLFLEGFPYQKAAKGILTKRYRVLSKRDKERPLTRVPVKGHLVLAGFF